MRVALVIACLSIVACGSSETPSSSPGDAAAEASADTGPDNSAGTTGAPCTNDGECDPLDAGDAAPFCSTNLAAGSLYPAPVCIGAPCDIGDGTTIAYCDKNAGVCLSTGSGGICVGSCDFSDDGEAPTGCVEGDVCNPYGGGKTEAGTVIGVGYCLGGCRVDADCKHAGEKCQVETGFCRRSIVTFGKSPGDPCTEADDGTACNCLLSRDGKGYCANACQFGDACAPGFTCDPMLPKTLDDGSPAFPKVPVGIAGYCLKDCASDDECAPLGGYCDENAGTGRKTCQIGTRP